MLARVDIFPKENSEAYWANKYKVLKTAIHRRDRVHGEMLPSGWPWLAGQTVAWTAWVGRNRSLVNCWSEGNPVQKPVKIEILVWIPNPKFNVHLPCGPAHLWACLKEQGGDWKIYLYIQLHSVIRRISNGESTQVHIAGGVGRGRSGLYIQCFQSVLEKNQSPMRSTAVVAHEDSQVKWVRRERTHAAHHLQWSA